MMLITEQKHRSAVANFLAGKVQEFAYQLRVIVDACDQSLVAYKNQQANPDGAVVVYGFSAFTNAIQTLKDGLKTIGGPSLTWAQIGQLSHGDFMSKARNAATHDGNPIVNAWVEGRYFVATNISRLDMRNSIVEIIRPEEDVRTICLRFAVEYAAILCDGLRPMLGLFQIGGSPIDRAEFDAVMQDSTLIPEQVKQLYEARKEEIHQAIVSAPPFDPIEKAIANLDTLSVYCKHALSGG